MNRTIDYFTNILALNNSLDHSILDYGSKNSQLIKFKVISELMPLETQSILDVGCGLCDFQQYLLNSHHGRPNEFFYTGIDVTPKMVERAKQKYGSDINVICSSLDRYRTNNRYDIVIANGIFYLEDDGMQAMRASVSKMFGLATKGVIFNSLSLYAKHKESNEFYADPVRVIKEVVLPHTNQYILRSDYHERDFTVAMYKDDHRY